MKDKTTSLINVYVTPAEKKKLKEYAEAVSRPLSNLMRMAALEHIEKGKK